MGAYLLQLLVGVGLESGGGRVGNGHVAQLGKLVGVEELGQTGGLLQVVLPAIVQLDLAVGLGALGLHQQHAVGGARSIDGGGSGILEHCDALDVVGVQVGEARLAV